MGPDDVARARAVLGTAAPFPALDGEPVFAEPWEGRAFALAVDVVDRQGLPWEAFRSRLVAAIAADPQRPYYESWVVALEDLVLATGVVAAAELARERDEVATYRYHEQALGDVEVVPLRIADELPAVLATLDPPVTIDVAACRHAERYRVLPAGRWRLRTFDADDVVTLDVPAPPR